MPDLPEPQTAIPVAKARFFSKYDVTLQTENGQLATFVPF